MILLVAACCAAFTGGCAKPTPPRQELPSQSAGPARPPRRPAARPEPRDVARRTPPVPVPTAAEARVIGTSIGGQPIRCYRFGTGPDALLILGGIHGNEPGSARLVETLADRLRQRDDLLRGRTIWVLPVANPDGLADRSRLNRRHVDLNRNFPADNRRELVRYGAAPLSEPEAAALHRLIQEARPRRIVSLHQAAACVDYDGPARGLAEAMSEACGLPVRRLGGKPGSLGSWAGDVLSIPTITLELPGSATRMPEAALWTRFGPALEAAISWGGRAPATDLR